MKYRNHIETISHNTYDFLDYLRRYSDHFNSKTITMLSEKYHLQDSGNEECYSVDGL